MTGTDLRSEGSLARRHGRPVTAYLKPSDFCNVGCTHCYIPADLRASKLRMSPEILSHAIDAIQAMRMRQRAPGILIVWHGGEPLALPRSYLESACSEVRRRMPEATQSLQTSLIPYSGKWAELVHRYFGGEIGSSLDFTQRRIHGSPERYRSFWMSKVGLARKDGLRVVPGVVPSIGEIGKGGLINDWMIEHGFEAWNIDRYNSAAGPDPLRPPNREHSAFLTEVFMSVMAHFRNGMFIRVNTVVAALGGVLHNRTGDRWGGRCSHDFIVVNPDGSTNACPDMISFEHFSDIARGFDGFQGSSGRKKWIREHLSGHQTAFCAACPFNSFCRGGCPLTPNAPSAEGECSGYHGHLVAVSDWVKLNHFLARDYLERADA